MVEIDHGFGIVTRYGHLHKILVKKGQRISYRQKIALIGSSGRSTGPHLHYEIQYGTIPMDPMRFIKAGKYVFKEQGRSVQ
jgi:murein DD-endopeptidase MepM/ murein hydrolase activator NlpD